MSQTTGSLVSFVSTFVLLVCFTLPICLSNPLGQWELLVNSTGVSAMHMQLLPSDRVIMFDRTDFGQSNITMPDGRCRNDSSDIVLKYDCTAHSVEYDALTNTVRPLTILTDTWCSSGSLMPDGSLVQTGGYNDGDRAVRVFRPCNNYNSTCDWLEQGKLLNVKRWYSTNQLLPDGRQIIIGGIFQNNYEYYPKSDISWVVDLPFLQETYDKGIQNNLYPFVFLNTDGNLFIFSNNRAILFSYKNNTVVRNYPTVPGGDPRNYPSTGSAALLPINMSNIVAEVLVCGGSPIGSFSKALKQTFVKALDTCARMKINDPNPEWEMEKMPMARIMGDMTLLPNGEVLIINGGEAGTAGWELGRHPVLSPVLYKPNNTLGSRFEVANPSTIPRMYHSSAVLLRDGRVLVGGSNSHQYYNFSGVIFPTELRLEAFYPPYMDPSYDHIRPKILSSNTSGVVGYGETLAMQFREYGYLYPELVSVTMVFPSFATHSFSMNQRALVLENLKVFKLRPTAYEVQFVAPGSALLAPPGYYMLFVVYRSIPSQGIWVQIK